MSFNLGLLTFKELRVLFQEIQCVNFLPFYYVVVQTTVNFPVAFYNLPPADEHKVFVDSDDLIHVIYISTVYNLQQQLPDLGFIQIPFVIVVNALELIEGRVDIPILDNMQFFTNINQDRPFIDEWEGLLKNPKTDSDDPNRDEELSRLYSATRTQLKLGNTTKPIMTQIMRIITTDIVHMKTSIDAYQRLTEAVDVKINEERNDGGATKVLQTHVLKPAPSLSYASLTQDEAKSSQSTSSGTIFTTVRDEAVDEKALNRLKDYVSIFIRATCGSIDMKMIEAFIVMPPIGNLTRNRHAFEEYINTLTATVRSSIMQADIWIRDFSKDMTNIYEVASLFGNSQDANDYRIYVTSTQLCGQLIRSAKADNPMRGLHTRFSIPLNQRNINDILDDLKVQLRVKFGTTKRSKGILQVEEDTRWKYAWLHPSSTLQ